MHAVLHAHALQYSRCVHVYLYAHSLCAQSCDLLEWPVSPAAWLQPLTMELLSLSSIVLPCRPCHYVAVDMKRGNIVLGVRGSLELGDLETDVTAAPLPFEFQVRLLPCLTAVGLKSEEGCRPGKVAAAPSAEAMHLATVLCM